ncbi:unnamed protein product [Cylindrotheca closterium]|uniref:RING-type domain-containing protein n=1 Tax=Cylindrotheca closterium TaxID=2856 RepID=A0AAD2FHZ7_9STRA|nr:unnamed protein product [Cylindrotheca closterium]
MNDNTCSICLEALLGSEANQKVGTTVPCGHCFHADCFEMWKATKGRSCKCPNCNVQSKKFVTLFLSVGAEMNANDDDLSLSSTEQDDDDVERDNEDMQQSNDNEGIDTGEQAESRGSQQQSQDTIVIDDDEDDNAENDDDDSVQVVDLTMSPLSSPPARQVRQLTESSSSSASTPPSSSVARRPRPAAPKTSPSTGNDNSGDQNDRFKKIAKKYKRKFQQKQSQCQEQYKQHQELTARMNEIQNAAAEKEGKLRQLQEQSQMQQLEIDHLSLVDVRRLSELNSKNRQVAKLTSDVQRLNTEYTKLKASYEKDLCQAHSSSTAEVKELAARTKDVEQENARLRAAMPQYGGGGRNNSMYNAGALQKKKTSKRQDNNDVARALRGMDAVRTIPGSSKRKSADEEAPVHDTTRYSAQASRIAMAGQKKQRKGPLGAAAAAMLSNSSSSSKPKSSRHHESMTMSTTSLTVNHRNRRPLQRINSHDASHSHANSQQTKHKNKAPPKMASMFQRR